MWKALVIKELRESAGLAALAALAIIYSLSGLTAMGLLPWQSRTLFWYPFVNDELWFYLWLCCGGLAIALGFKQTAWEIGQGTLFFLLHRPVSRHLVFASKLLVGVGCVLILSAAFILLYSWWAVVPAHVPAPFEWSMTAPAWEVWVAIPILYFGAFLSGVRPARWFGTRLVPLVAAICVAVLAGNVPWWWLSLITSCVAAVIFGISIFYYAQQRDY
jgi:hypothetical protein